MFSFLVNGKEKDTKNVFYKAEPIEEHAEELGVDPAGGDQEIDVKDDFEKNEQLVQLMKNNDGKWMDQLANKYNSSGDDDEEEEEYSDDGKDMYGVEQEKDSNSSSEHDSDNNDSNNSDNEQVFKSNDSNGEKEDEEEDDDEDVEPKYPVDRTIFVKSLSFDTTEENLQIFFKDNDVGVEQCVLEKNNSGRSAGFAYVVFVDNSSMLQAMKIYDGAKLDGRSIQFAEYDPKLSYRRDGKRKRKKKKINGDEQKQLSKRQRGQNNKRRKTDIKIGNNGRGRGRKDGLPSRSRGRGRGRGGTGFRGRGRGGKDSKFGNSGRRRGGKDSSPSRGRGRGGRGRGGRDGEKGRFSSTTHGIKNVKKNVMVGDQFL